MSTKNVSCLVLGQELTHNLSLHLISLTSFERGTEIETKMSLVRRRESEPVKDELVMINSW